MTKAVLLSILFFLLIIFSTLSIKADKQLYYLGENFFDFYHEIPLNIKPMFRYNFEGGFKLSDKYGLSILYIGENKYWKSNKSITVKKFNYYGFTKDVVIADVYDINKKRRFVKFSKSKLYASNDDFDITTLRIDSTVNNQKYKWISIDENLHHAKYVSRNLLFLFTLIIVGGIGACLFVRRNKPVNA